MTVRESNRDTGEKHDDVLALPRNHGAWHFTFEKALQDSGRMERETVLLYVLTGYIEVKIVGQHPLKVEPGDLLILPPAQAYDRLVAAKTQFLVVCGALCRFEFDDSPRALSLEHDEVAVRWMKDLTVFASYDIGQRDITDHLLTAILARLKQIERRESALRSLHPSVAAAVQFLDDNVAAPLTLGEVAAHVHLSPSHLRALFHKQVGSGVLRYQQDRRMQLALELLDQPDLSLREVAHRCGYSDTEYFARLFRRYHHTSPGLFRRRHPTR